jgi:DNA-binding CsgD family transcriptional regulator
VVLAHRWQAMLPEEPECTAEGRTPRDVAQIDGLSAAETRVATLAADGRSNPEIADVLSVTRRTVELHLTHVYRKLGAGGRTELAARLAALREGERGSR